MGTFALDAWSPIRSFDVSPQSPFVPSLEPYDMPSRALYVSAFFGGKLEFIRKYRGSFPLFYFLMSPLSRFCAFFLCLEADEMGSAGVHIFFPYVRCYQGPLPFFLTSTLFNADSPLSIFSSPPFVFFFLFSFQEPFVEGGGSVIVSPLYPFPS